MKCAAGFSKLLRAMRASDKGARSTVAAMPAPLIVALEPRIVYDASAASIMVAAVAAQHHAIADAQPTGAAREASPAAGQGAAASGLAAPAATSTSTSDAAASMRAVHGYTTATVADSSTMRAVHGFTDTVAQGADKQVVFINSNVTDLQTLVAGLPAGTQYVVLDSTKDGLLQIEQYLQEHPGVSAIHLVSHGAAGEFQVGSTWINEADLSTYSAEFAQIGAAMKSGGDFLIYGCDVAENADGKALVEARAVIATRTGRHVYTAASTSDAVAVFERN